MLWTQNNPKREATAQKGNFSLTQGSQLRERSRSYNLIAITVSNDFEQVLLTYPYRKLSPVLPYLAIMAGIFFFCVEIISFLFWVLYIDAFQHYGKKSDLFFPVQSICRKIILYRFSPLLGFCVEGFLPSDKDTYSAF